MQKYFAIVFFIGLCYGHSLGLEEDILGLPVLDYDDSKNYDLFWNAQYNILQQEKNQKQELDRILKELCESNDLTLEDILIDCENIKITPKVNKAVIKKRDLTEVLEEGSGDDAPDDPKFEENKETGSVTEQSVSVESAPVETVLVDSAPVKPTPEKLNKENSASSVDSAQAEAGSAPEEAAAVKAVALKAGKVEAVPMEAVPVEAAPVEATPVKTATIEAAPVEAAPVEAAPVEAAPVEAAPVEAAPVEAAPVETAPVKEAVTVKAAPVEAAPVEAAPVEAAPVEAAPVDAAPVDAAPLDSVSVKPIELGSVPSELAPEETVVVKHESSVEPDKSVPESTKTAEPVSKAATVSSESVKETTISLNKEENNEIEKDDKSSGSNVEEFDEKNETSEDKKGRKLTQEYINDEQTGNAILKVDAGITETEAKLSKMKTNESMKTASIGGVGESTEANVGRSDNKILITLFVGVLAVGVAAFSYNYIKKRKRISTQSRTNNGVVQSDPEAGSEMKPLVGEHSPNVEYKNEKTENVST